MIGMPPSTKKVKMIDDEIDLDFDEEPPPPVFASYSTPPTTQDVEFMPPYFMKHWTTLLTKRNMITIYLLMLSGSTDPGRVKVSVTDDGRHLVIKNRVPDIMIEEGLTTLHRDEDTDKKVQTDFHYRLGALNQAVREAKEIWGPPSSDGAYYWTARIPLEFPCEKSFKIRNKADRMGAKIVYITFKAKGNEEETTLSAWPVLDGDQ
jgi:hypothetical protein